MSAVAALHFDPVFGMGSRQTYSSWPVIESSQHSLFDPDLSSTYASDTSVSPPPTSRSITGSPQHYSLSLTLQEREVKRQQTQARRHEKIISRRTADCNIDGILTSGGASPKHSSIVGSPSYLHSSPPAVTVATMADLSAPSATGSLPGIYTSSAPSQMSLMSTESVATRSAGLNSPSYYSPSMHDHGSNQGVFSTPAYHNQQYMPEYTTASFPSAASSTLHSQYPRTAMPEPNMVYHMPPPHSSIMGAGHMHQQHQHQQPAHQQAPAHHSPLPHPMAQQHRSHHHSNGGGHHQGQNSPSMSHTHAHSHSQAHPQTHPQAHAHAHAHSAPHHHPHSYDGVVGSAVGVPGSAGVRVVQSRPKPQCWEHGCNGRQFSTFSNLLRHQREKSGQAAKAVCPNCGAEFTRTTARNGHLQHDKCKQRQRN